MRMACRRVPPSVEVAMTSTAISSGMMVYGNVQQELLKSRGVNSIVQ